ncbi:tyrosine-protein kinase RYK-like [Galendromus occidentalis]|uniref:Tyrosine-protein kinase RYK-like n=1 Tax=Galendromus occidentalis TaxID=34638 RepID=A0AAJ6QWR1_9ACAR|nr:tyrosine-protein kinase RYK-like [Galendromus occidentalis]
MRLPCSSSNHFILLPLLWLTGCETFHGQQKNGQKSGHKKGPTLNFNLFLRQEESQRMLGINVSLYYVKEGSMNDYALRFPVPVPGNLSRLEFTWQNLRPQQSLKYRIEMTVDNPEAMQPPKLDIPSTGNLPVSSPSSFVVFLSCTGMTSAEVRIGINLNISAAGEETSTTLVKIQRKKVCLKDEKKTSRTSTTRSPTAHVYKEDVDEDDTDEDGDEENTIFVSETQRVEHGRRNTANTSNTAMVMDDAATTPLLVADGNSLVLYAVAGAAVVVAMSLMTATTLCYVRTRKLQSLNQHQGNVIIQATADKYLQEWITASSTLHLKAPQYSNKGFSGKMPVATGPTNRFLRVPGSPVASTVASYSSFRKPNFGVPPSPAPPMSLLTMHSAAGVNSSAGQYSTINDTFKSSSSTLSEQLAELAVDARCLTLVKLLTEGSFGRIYHALLNTSSGNSSAESQPVLVKTVTEQTSSDQRRMFMQEGMMLVGMNHTNVMPVVGTCLDMPNGQPALLYPFMNEGNLAHFLQRSKFSRNSPPRTETAHPLTTLSTQDLVDMAVQIAEGLMFLHRRFFLHKDIATRNCMVDERLHVKLTDNALARDFFSEDYHWMDDSNRDQEQEKRPVKWLALESLQKREFTPASDLWMLGVTLWELLTLGQPPFPEVDPRKMVTYLQSGYRLPQPTNCPDELYDVMFRCWSMCPGERLTLPQMLRALANFYNQLGSYI